MNPTGDTLSPQRKWAAMNPRASQRDPITLDEVMSSRMIAYPFRKLMCCLVTDGGGALILTAVAATAALIPALRASRVDPLVALRQE